MRNRVERVRCPVCRNSDVLRKICTACKGDGEAIIVHKTEAEIEIHPLKDEAALRQMYPDTAKPVHERETVARGWHKFAHAIFNGTSVPRIQHNEMKKAFYAGAIWVMDTLASQLDPDHEPTADDLEYMQRIHAELTRFAEQIKAEQN